MKQANYIRNDIRAEVGTNLFVSNCDKRNMSNGNRNEVNNNIRSLRLISDFCNLILQILYPAFLLIYTINYCTFLVAIGRIPLGQDDL